MKTKNIITTILILILLTTVISASYADVLMPQEGKKVKTSGKLTVDYSNCSEGYVMIKAKPSKHQWKLDIFYNEEFTGTYESYDLNNNGEYETYPLLHGTGKYFIWLYIESDDNIYESVASVTIKATIPDKTSCFLYPNHVINYTPDTPAVVFAQTLCDGVTDPKQKLEIIRDYVFWGTGDPDATMLKYRAPGLYDDGLILPDIDKAFTTRTGVCRDFAGLLTAMLRSVGIPARYVVGYVNRSYHAWVVVILNDKNYYLDPTYMKDDKAIDRKSYKIDKWY